MFSSSPGKRIELDLKLKFMRHTHHSILLLICLTVLFASFVGAQEKTNLTDCNNQLVFPNADFDNFEKPVTGNVKQILEQDTDLTDNVQEDLVETINYNERGNITDTFLTSSKIKMFGKTIYSYDEKNRLVKEVSYNPDGSAVSEDILTYAPDGNLIQFVTRNAKTKIAIWKKDFSHDPKKSYSEFIDKLRDYGFGFIKDAQCRMTEVISYKADRTITGKVLISYDDKQNTAEQTFYSPTGNVIGKKKTEFEFDSKGNWIKRKRFEMAVIDGKLSYQPVDMTNRKITYFETK